MKNLIAVILLFIGIYLLIKAVSTILTIVLILIAAYIFLPNKKPVNKIIKKIFGKK